MATAQLAQLDLKVGDITAHVVRAGSGYPLVYLHGAFAYRGWHPFLEMLARRFTVYAPLHPGFSEDSSGAQLEDLVDLVLYHYDLLEALGLERPHILGHHFGAMIAAEMAALCPHRVGRLVLAAPTGLWLDDAPGVDYFATPMSELRSVLFLDPGSAVAKAAMPDPASDEQRTEQNVERVRSLSAVARFLWPIPDKGLKRRLPRIKSPTLVVMASHDRIVPPAYGQEVARRVPHSRVEVIQGAGHLFMLEKPDQTASLVARFLE